jgi:hypothetical protein
MDRMMSVPFPPLASLIRSLSADSVANAQQHPQYWGLPRALEAHVGLWKYGV